MILGLGEMVERLAWWATHAVSNEQHRNRDLVLIANKAQIFLETIKTCISNRRCSVVSPIVSHLSPGRKQEPATNRQEY